VGYSFSDTGSDSFFGDMAPDIYSILGLSGYDDNCPDGQLVQSEIRRRNLTEGAART